LRVVQIIANLSSSDEELKELQSQLSQLQEIIIGNLDQIDAALANLHPQKNTYGYLFLLGAKCAFTNMDPFVFVDQVVGFINAFSTRQLRMDLKKFKYVCSKFVDICGIIDQPLRAIKPLKHAIHKIAPDSGHITPQHYLLLLACMRAKCYKAALPILESHVFSIDTSKTGIESVDIRLYYYYGGIIYSTLKNFKKAQEFFFHVVSFPAFVTSEIMVEAYKKYILVSILCDGSVPSISRFANHNFIRQVKNWCSAYEDLATSYGVHSVDDLQKCVTNHTETYVKDRNYGLVKQVLKSLYKENISKLTKTYLTLSLKNIAEQVKLNDIRDVEEKVLQMIRNGQIYASINQKDGMVSFFENPDQYDTPNTLNYLDTNIHGLMNLNVTVKHLDETISLSQQYIQKMVQSERGKFGPGVGGEEMFGEMDPAGFRG